MAKDLDLDRVVANYNAEKEELRAGAALAAEGFAETIAACVSTRLSFEKSAAAINAEAARRGLPPVVSPIDLAGELDLALMLRGVQLPAGSTFTALTNGTVNDE